VNNKKVYLNVIPLHPQKNIVKIKKRMMTMNIIDQVQKESNNQGGDKDGGDKDSRNSRPTPPHPRVCHTVQRDHRVDNILRDIKKGVTTRSHIVIFLALLVCLLF
jgi:mRNA deadenylase 3'-5' endonuclease subunit Ccr4